MQHDAPALRDQDAARRKLDLAPSTRDQRIDQIVVGVVFETDETLGVGLRQGLRP